jgi:hypothetical protein
MEDIASVKRMLLDVNATSALPERMDFHQMAVNLAIVTALDRKITNVI